jgi:hypothetical protein
MNINFSVYQYFKKINTVIANVKSAHLKSSIRSTLEKNIYIF